MSKVTFNTDVYPYVKGDVVDLEKGEKARIDAVIKARGLENAYDSGVHQVFDTVSGPAEADLARRGDARDAVKDQLVDQAATLEAQRNSVPEPANVEALGVEQETPTQTVTGTEPVAGVKVKNPQEVTDLGSDAEADIKVKPKK